MELRDSKGMTEQEFLEAYSKKNYPRPYLTADIVILSENADRVLLVKRKGHPFIAHWAFPGGFAEIDETIEGTAARELREETGIQNLPDIAAKLVGVYSKPGRDPRGWVVTTAFFARVNPADTKVTAGDDAAQAKWFQIHRDEQDHLTLTNGEITLTVTPDQSDLAFDHGEILLDTLNII